jgi:hypothetical protein
MDHAEARELLDVAAVEPGGLDRLMAGDTPIASALAGHLAGCTACMDEYGRLRRSSAVLRDVIATQPPPELRERTLAMIAAVGRARGPAAQGSLASPIAGGSGVDGATVASGVAPHLRVVEVPARRAAVGRMGRSRLAWLGLAAALVLASVGTTGYVVSTARDASAHQAAQELEGLSEVATWTVHLDAQPDVRHVVLTGSTAAAGGDPAQVGTLIFSAATKQMLVVADGAANPPAGQEYRCWVEIGGTRQRLGRMDVSGDLAYWAGDAPVLASVPSGAVFGVSLADIAGAGGSSPAILSGTLQAT